MLFSIFFCILAHASAKNVILISLDTVSANHLRYYGYHNSTMPFLDELAAKNITFTQAYSSAAYTLASHVSMFTGVSPQTHGVRIGEKEEPASTFLSEKIPSLAEYFRNAGYTTSWAGILTARHLERDLGLGRGFDHVHRNLIDEIQDTTNQSELHALAQTLKQKPFFAFFHTYFAHLPYRPKAPYENIFGATLPKKAIQNDQEVRQLRLQSYIKNPQYFSEEVKDEWVSQFNFSSFEDISLLQNLYDAGLRNLDQKLMQFFLFLIREGLLENTVVVITADHGEAFGEHSQIFHSVPYLDQLHVPLTFIFPQPVAKKIETRVYGVDLLPTLLEIADLKPDPLVEGVSLLPLIQDKPLKRKNEQQFAVGNISDSVSSGEWRLVLQKNKAPELFGSKDAREENNVAQSNAHKVVELQKLLKEKIDSAIKGKPRPPLPTLTLAKAYWLKIYDLPPGMLAHLRKALRKGFPHLNSLRDSSEDPLTISKFYDTVSQDKMLKFGDLQTSKTLTNQQFLTRKYYRNNFTNAQLVKEVLSKEPLIIPVNGDHSFSLSREGIDSLLIAFENQTLKVKKGQWSAWLFSTATNKPPISFRLNLQELDKDNQFAARVEFNNLENVLLPNKLEKQLVYNWLGPYVQMNAPHLPAFPSDRNNYETIFSFQWHANALALLFDRLQPEAVQQQIQVSNFSNESSSRMAELNALFSGVEQIIEQGSNAIGPETRIFITFAEHCASSKCPSLTWSRPNHL